MKLYVWTLVHYEPFALEELSTHHVSVVHDTLEGAQAVAKDAIDGLGIDGGGFYQYGPGDVQIDYSTPEVYELTRGTVLPL